MLSTLDAVIFLRFLIRPEQSRNNARNSMDKILDKLEWRFECGKGSKICPFRQVVTSDIVTDGCWHSGNITDTSVSV